MGNLLLSIFISSKVQKKTLYLLDFYHIHSRIQRILNSYNNWIIRTIIDSKLMSRIHEKYESLVHEDCSFIDHFSLYRIAHGHCGVICQRWFQIEYFLFLFKILTKLMWFLGHRMRKLVKRDFVVNIMQIFSMNYEMSTLQLKTLTGFNYDDLTY